MAGFFNKFHRSRPGAMSTKEVKKVIQKAGLHDLIYIKRVDAFGQATSTIKGTVYYLSKDKKKFTVKLDEVGKTKVSKFESLDFSVDDGDIASIQVYKSGLEDEKSMEEENVMDVQEVIEIIEALEIGDTVRILYSDYYTGIESVEGDLSKKDQTNENFSIEYLFEDGRKKTRDFNVNKDKILSIQFV